MELVDQLRSMQTAEIEALDTPKPIFGGIADMTDLSGGFVGAAMMEDRIIAVLDGASDEELRAALEAATAAHEDWSINHLEAAVKRRFKGG